MKCLGIIFTNLSFEKLLSHEALVAGSVTTTNKQTQLFKYAIAINEKKCSSDIASFDSFRSKLFAKVI